MEVPQHVAQEYRQREQKEGRQGSFQETIHSRSYLPKPLAEACFTLL